MARQPRWLIFCAAILFLGAFSATNDATHGSVPAEEGLRFTILYDNYLHKEGTHPDWGFSCLIEGTEKTILFDTGTQPQILMENVDALGIDLKKVEQVVISHGHGDHAGGLPGFLERNHQVTVYFPVSFPADFAQGIERSQAKAKAVDRPVEICRDVFLTGEMGDAIKEQSLIIDTPKGLIIVTGCSHQGILNVLERAREVRDKPIRLVFGGFHLGDKSETEMREIIAGFKAMKVGKCGATHCTGDAQIAMFKEAFGESYVPMGTGRIIKFSDL